MGHNSLTQVHPQQLGDPTGNYATTVEADDKTTQRKIKVCRLPKASIAEPQAMKCNCLQERFLKIDLHHSPACHIGNK